MATFLSILRGINVSGQKKINMADLKSLYENLGFKNIKTYIQSGNVIFENNTGKDLSKKIEKQIEEKYGFQVPILIRTVNEMEEAVNKNPFLEEKNIEPDKLHVTYLSDIPSNENLEKMKTVDYRPDRFYVSGKEIYLYCPGGYGNTKLTNTFFEKKLKQTATTRNWKTTNALLKMMNPDS
jgi:uncharacterized protein (DUF1697 family)